MRFRLANWGEALFNFSVPHGKQLIWIGISIVLALMILILDSRFIEASSYVAYFLGIILLVMTLFIGKEVNGAKSWIVLGGQNFQPSEFAKMATALALAKYMSRLNFSLSNGQDLLVVIFMILTPAVIVIFQNDTGSALVFAALFIVLFREGMNPLFRLS